MAALEPYEREFFKTARDAGRREHPEAFAFDALIALTDDASGGDVSKPRRDSTVVVLVDHSAFVRGHTEPGEVCEIAGVGPIPVAVARRLGNDAFLKALITDGEDVRAVSHLGRTIPARLRTAIEELQRECVIAGCHVGRHLQLDHNVPIEEGGPTALWNLNRLCAWDHQEKTRLNLRLEGEGTRKRLIPGPSPPPPDERARPPARELALV